MLRVVSTAIVAGAVGCCGGLAARAQTAGSDAPAPDITVPGVGEITVTAQRLTEPRQAIAASVGASSYGLTNQSIQNLPGGDNASLSNVLLQAPGVAQDNQANGSFHIRNEHLDAQYRVNGVMLPPGVSFFGEGLSPRFVQSMNLITGTLPAQYGLRTSGVVDITTKNDFDNTGSVGMYGGSYWTMQPSADYSGKFDGFDYFVSGDFTHNDHGINSPVPNYDAVHDETNQEHGFGYIAKNIDPDSKLSALVGSFVGRFQIPNNPGQPIANTVAGSSAFDFERSQRESKRERAVRHPVLPSHRTGLGSAGLGFQQVQHLALLPGHLRRSRFWRRIAICAASGFHQRGSARRQLQPHAGAYFARGAVAERRARHGRYDLDRRMHGGAMPGRRRGQRHADFGGAGWWQDRLDL